ncbi:hypothetical protein Tsp_10175 [Trichinella spiralis]|uniref:hypothetical protein n=1 Tax=Trichinella spiralis TaxID=6334 RepID=UPI0001EFDBCB|nr:hypothetical protein Tsp_10175 [Trichinella spiralis]
MRFSLNVAPLLMKAMLNCWLSQMQRKLVRHFLVYGAESSSGLHQTKANDAKTNWDELMEGGELRALIEETALAVKKHDPARHIVFHMIRILQMHANFLHLIMITFIKNKHVFSNEALIEKDLLI